MVVKVTPRRVQPPTQPALEHFLFGTCAGLSARGLLAAAVLREHVVVQETLRRVQLSAQPTPEHLLLGADVGLGTGCGLFAAAVVLVGHVVVQVALGGVQPPTQAALERLLLHVHPGTVVGQALPAAQRHPALLTDEAAGPPVGRGRGRQITVTS